MSVRLLFKSTNLEQRKKLVKDLTFESKDNYAKKTTTIYGFDTDETKEGNIYIPFSYAVENGYNNDFTYSKADIEFVGKLRPVQEEIVPKVMDYTTF